LEKDWILFPEDAVFEPVPQCTTGRVFVLKIISADMKTFFWMQEPKTDKDEEYAATINRLINTPPGGLYSPPLLLPHSSFLVFPIIPVP